MKKRVELWVKDPQEHRRYAAQRTRRRVAGFLLVQLAGLVLMSLGAIDRPFAWRVPRSSAGTITIAWTAPGDDSLSGIATAYEVRYSRDSLTLGTWDTSAIAPGAPPPAAPGTRQSFAVPAPPPGASYFFGIRTVDDAGNWSRLSNIVRQWTPADTDTIVPPPPPDTSSLPRRIILEP